MIEMSWSVLVYFYQYRESYFAAILRGSYWIKTTINILKIRPYM